MNIGGVISCGAWLISMREKGIWYSRLERLERRFHWTGLDDWSFLVELVDAHFFSFFYISRFRFLSCEGWTCREECFIIVLINSNHYPFHHTPARIFKCLYVYTYISMTRITTPVPQSAHYLTFAIVVQQSDLQLYFLIAAPHLDLSPHPSYWLPHSLKDSKLSR